MAVTEAEWLASADPGPMLTALFGSPPFELEDDYFPATGPTIPGLASRRKLRLFGCACCRGAWKRIRLPHGATAVELAELAQKRHPGIAILLTSGYARDLIPSDDGPDYPLIAKPYRAEELMARPLSELVVPEEVGIMRQRLGEVFSGARLLPVEYRGRAKDGSIVSMEISSIAIQFRGKPAVLEVIRQIAENFRVHRFDRESVMLGVDSAASMLRFTFTSLDSNKPVALRLAHFAQFKAGRLSRIRVLLDSFDLVEQALGRPIHLPKITSFA